MCTRQIGPLHTRQTTPHPAAAVLLHFCSTGHSAAIRGADQSCAGRECMLAPQGMQPSLNPDHHTSTSTQAVCGGATLQPPQRRRPYGEAAPLTCRHPLSDIPSLTREALVTPRCTSRGPLTQDKTLGTGPTEGPTQRAPHRGPTEQRPLTGSSNAPKSRGTPSAVKAAAPPLTSWRAAPTCCPPGAAQRCAPF